MDPSATRLVGRTGVAVTQLGLGGASYGELFHKVPEQDAFGAIQAAWDGGVRYYDTAPWYGRGLSELRTGAGLRDRPRVGVRAVDQDRPLAQGVARIRTTTARRGSAVRPSRWSSTTPTTASCGRTSRASSAGLARYDLAVIHDLDHLYHGDGVRFEGFLAQLATSGWRAITELKASGLIRGIGAGVNELGMIPRFLDIVDLDFFLVAMPYTLLHQEVLDAEFPACVERGIGFVIGAPYQSGILATGPREGANADYGTPTAGAQRDGRACSGRLRAPWRAARGRSPPVPAGPPERRGGHPGRPLCGPRPAQPRGLPAGHPGRPVGRTQARGSAPSGRAGPGVSQDARLGAAVEFTRASQVDAGEIMTVQRAAFVREAQLYHDPDVPPLVETLDQIRDAIAHGERGGRPGRWPCRGRGPGRRPRSSRPYRAAGGRTRPPGSGDRPGSAEGCRGQRRG